MKRDGLLFQISFFLLFSLSVIPNRTHSKDMTADEVNPKVLIKLLKASMGKGDFDRLGPHILDLHSFEWHTCDATDYDEPPIPFLEVISKLNKHIKDSTIIVNESFNIRKEMYFAVETSGWNGRKDNYIYIWAQKTEAGWKLFSACYSPNRHLEFLK